MGLTTYYDSIQEVLNYVLNRVSGALKVDLATGLNPTDDVVGISATADTTAGYTSSYRGTALVATAGGATGTQVKNSAGNYYGCEVFSGEPSLTVYLQIYNKATAPTVGTDTPVFTHPIPPGGMGMIPFPYNFPCSAGIFFAVTKNWLPAGGDAAPSYGAIVEILAK